MELVECSVCDADIGTRRKEGLCQGYCQTYYDACREDLFCEVGEDKTQLNSLDFCTNDEYDTSKLLQDMDITSQQFCHRMGFRVTEEPGCYDGTPTASLI